MRNESFVVCFYIILVSRVNLVFSKRSCVRFETPPDEWETWQKIALGTAAGVSAVVAAPVVLGAAGFGAAGVTVKTT